LCMLFGPQCSKPAVIDIVVMQRISSKLSCDDRIACLMIA